MRLCRWFGSLLHRRVEQHLKQCMRVRLSEPAPVVGISRAHLLSRFSVLPGLVPHVGDAPSLGSQPLGLVQRPSESRGGDLGVFIETFRRRSVSTNEARRESDGTHEKN